MRNFCTPGVRNVSMSEQKRKLLFNFVSKFWSPKHSDTYYKLFYRIYWTNPCSNFLFFNFRQSWRLSEDPEKQNRRKRKKTNGSGLSPISKQIKSVPLYVHIAKLRIENTKFVILIYFVKCYCKNFRYSLLKISKTSSITKFSDFSNYFFTFDPSPVLVHKTEHSFIR